jgi:hypothetical protein
MVAERYATEGRISDDVSFIVRIDPSPACSDSFCHAAARNSNADSHVYHLCVARAVSGRSFMHRWKVGRAPAEPAYQRRRRRALAAERKSRRRAHSIGAGLSRSERPVRTATLSVNVGPAVIVILMLSLGLWAMIWAAVALALRALA